jgi:hypothetical protein
MPCKLKTLNINLETVLKVFLEKQIVRFKVDRTGLALFQTACFGTGGVEPSDYTFRELVNY